MSIVSVLVGNRKCICFLMCIYAIMPCSLGGCSSSASQFLMIPRPLQLRGGEQMDGGWNSNRAHQRSRHQAPKKRWPQPLYAIEGITPRHRAAAVDLTEAHAGVAERMRDGDTAAALRLALDAATLHPEDQTMLMSAATLLELRSRHRDAAAKLEAILSLNATHTGALTALARITCFKTDLDVVRARNLAARAVAADANSAVALSIAAQIEHYGAHDLFAAKQFYRKALELNPQHFPSLTHLGRLLHAEAAHLGNPRPRSTAAAASAASASGEVWDGEGTEGAGFSSTLDH
jgi:tetratricopeptide (TPR) repeat protein